MNPAQKALWFIESHLADALTLDEIAAIAGISRFHMVRAFAAATGLSVMRYVRARRLSEAARALAGGAPDILSSRWMRITAPTKHSPARSATISGSRPKRSAARRVSTIFKLQEPIPMDSTVIDNLQPPRFETGKPLLVAGLGERYTCESGAAIPGQWQRFHQSVANIPGRIGKVAYGVCCNGDDAGNFDYIAGVEVADFSDLPREFSRVRIPEQRYAVFIAPRPHLDHPPHRQHDLESLAAGVRPEGGRRAELRAL